jgi:four helix bundle protein
MNYDEENIVLNKSFDFALKIIELYKPLKEHKEFVISKQLLRSGASIGANIEEANAAQLQKKLVKHDIGCAYCSKVN